MKKRYFIEIESYRDDGKLVENETDKELTEEEAIKVVQDGWSDMLEDYYSWKLKAVLFKYSDNNRGNGNERQR